jgi:uncharacterized protein (DUF1330 family)
MTIKTLTIGFSALALGVAFGSALAFSRQNIPGDSAQGTMIDVSNIQGLHHQATPPVYVVTLFDGKIDMNTDYPSLDPATFQPFGGRYVVHGGKIVTFEGTPPGQYVVIAFDSMEQVQAWRASAAFKEMRDIYKIGKLRVFAVEGTTQ